MLDKPTMKRLDKIEERLTELEQLLSPRGKAISKCRSDTEKILLGADIDSSLIPTEGDINAGKIETDLLGGYNRLLSGYRSNQIG